MNDMINPNSQLNPQDASYREAVISPEEQSRCDYDEVPDPPFDHDAPYDDTPMYTDDANYDPSSDF